MLRSPVLSSRPWAWGAVLFGLLASPAAAADLTIVVANVTQAKGQVRIAVFDGENGWPAAEPKFAAVVLPATSPEVRITLHDMPTSGVAISAFHDVNQNGSLDTNFLGIPKEPYAFSNASKDFGPAKITVPESGGSVTLQLVD